MRVLLRCAVVLAVLSAGGGAVAQRTTVSNTSVILASSSVTTTGGELSVVGLLHVQARVLPSGGVGVHMNVNGSAVGYGSVPGLLPEADAIRARIAEIKIELSALTDQVKAVEQELYEVRHTDINIAALGLQIDGPRSRELKAQLEELLARVSALKGELAQLLLALEQLLDEFDRTKPDPIYQFTLFTPLGAAAQDGVSCTDDLLCQSLLSIDLVAASGEVVPFQMLVTMAFRADGTLASADAVPCEIVCEGDSGSCFCS